MAGDRLVDEEPLLRQLGLDFVLRQDVPLHPHVELCLGAPRRGAQLPHAQVGLGRQGQLGGDGAVLVGGHLLLEDLDALGVLDLDRGRRLHRLQFAIQGHQPHLDLLPGLVDGFVGLEKEQRPRLYLH